MRTALLTVAALLLLPGVVGALALRWLRRHIVLVTVSGVSMAPTFRDSDRLLARRATPSTIRTGCVVVAERPVQTGDSRWEWLRPDTPASARRWMIKRVAALPGEPLPPSVAVALGATAAVTVPTGFVVLLGDNTTESIDSRMIGLVPADRVFGVVLRRLGRPARQPTVWLDPAYRPATPTAPESPAGPAAKAVTGAGAVTGRERFR